MILLTSIQIHLFYISQNTSINFVIWETRSASWFNDTSTYGGIEDFQVRPNTRSLSAVFRQNQTSNDLQESLGNAAGGIGQKYPILTSQNLTTYLMFEGPTGDVVWLLGYWGFSPTTDSSASAWNWVWINLDLKAKVAASYALLVEHGRPLPSIVAPFVNAIAPTKESNSTYDVEIFSLAALDNGDTTDYQYWRQAYEDSDSGSSMHRAIVEHEHLLTRIKLRHRGLFHSWNPRRHRYDRLLSRPCNNPW